jgi:hypothetical protein
MHPLRGEKRLHWIFVLLNAAGRIAVVHLPAVILLLASAGIGSAAVRVEAYRGEPFGIGRVTVDLPPGASKVAATDDRFALTEANGRVLYPVLESQNRPVRRLLRSFLNVELSGRATFYFMFRSDEPLDLVVYAPEAQPVTARPEDNAEAFHELLDEWWEATGERFQEVFQQAEYPVVVENYLTATWAHRLGREMPEPSRYLLRQFRWGDPWVSQLAANEAYRTEIERELLLGRLGAGEQANIPLLNSTTSNARPPGLERAEASGDTELPAPLEPIAAHVPHECFYMRFGNFPNYLWFRDFMRHWQGDLTNMLVMQSVDHDNSERFQQQIAVGESKLARVMGPTVIRDVAIIGLDMYLRDGAAMGILFHANNGALLRRNLGGQRQDAMNRHEGATEKTVRIAGHDVSYTSSPDGRLRSYYAIDGDFHLVANSRRLVERFFEAGSGKGELAASDEFREARTARPLTSDDTIFIYISAAFLENLASPHYRVELDRRLRSIGEMRALILAPMAAQAEGHNAQTIDEFIAAELLPAGFGQRIDGSKLVAAGSKSSPAGSERGEGESNKFVFHDSLRGFPGRMVPIPDVPVERVTRSEARRLEEFQQGLQSSVGRFSPISIALKRSESPADAGWDRITADVRITPYAQMPIGRWPNMLGPAATIQVAPIAGDVASLELVVDALGEPIHLFGGLRDFHSPLVVREGEVEAEARASEYVRAYVGSWPRPHLLDRFLGRADGPYDDEGIARTRGLFDLWLRRADDFFLFSFKRDVLLEVGQQLAMVDAQAPAQIRLFIDDLSDKQVADAVTAYGYMRARNASASAARFMNSLTTHLHVSPEDAAPLAEALVGGKFACPLGGDYELVTASGEEESLPAPDGAVASRAAPRLLWASTATPPENRFLLTTVPADYTMPLMNWFRGLDARVARVDDELTLHADLDMVHLEVGPPEDPDDASGGFKLPSLGGLFSGFGKTDDQVKPASAREEESNSDE